MSKTVAELKGLARNCDFGKTSTGVNLTEKLILEENLRDRLVCGMADTAIQRRLLGESDLSFDKAFQLALAMESAATNAAQLHTKDTTVYYADADKVSTRKQCSHKVKKRDSHSFAGESMLQVWQDDTSAKRVSFQRH